MVYMSETSDCVDINMYIFTTMKRTDNDEKGRMCVFMRDSCVYL